MAIEERISTDHERARSQLAQACEDLVQVGLDARVHDIELQSEAASRLLHVLCTISVTALVGLTSSAMVAAFRTT